jgi:cyclopropane fatty-acyl-phospholipid synthase-like methyltransferase
MKSLNFGRESDRIPDVAFRMMSLVMKTMDLFNPRGKLLDTFGIQPGFVVMDYGCGPARYINRASQLVGDNGKVYAVDIHELAIDSVNALINRKGLQNVTAVLTRDLEKVVAPASIDLIYALDMFHMVSDTNGFLKGVYEMLKPGGIFILEDGHQPRKLAKQKVEKSGYWKVVEETSGHMKCRPV